MYSITLRRWRWRLSLLFIYFSFHFLVILLFFFATLITGAHLFPTNKNKREGHANVSGEKKKQKKKSKRATNRIIDQQHHLFFFFFPSLILLGLFLIYRMMMMMYVRFIGPIFVFVKYHQLDSGITLYGQQCGFIILTLVFFRSSCFETERVWARNQQWRNFSFNLFFFFFFVGCIMIAALTGALHIWTAVASRQSCVFFLF
jgi:hypothetical protein